MSIITRPAYFRPQGRQGLKVCRWLLRALAPGGNDVGEHRGRHLARFLSEESVPGVILPCSYWNKPSLCGDTGNLSRAVALSLLRVPLCVERSFQKMRNRTSAILSGLGIIALLSHISAKVISAGGLAWPMIPPIGARVRPLGIGFRG